MAHKPDVLLMIIERPAEETSTLSTSQNRLTLFADKRKKDKKKKDKGRIALPAMQGNPLTGNKVP